MQPEHAPLLPVTGPLAGGFNPEPLAEIVGNCKPLNSCQRACGQLKGYNEPVVGIHKSELHKQQLGKIGGGGLDVAEVCLALLKLPPAGVGHPVKLNMRGYKAACEGILPAGARITTGRAAAVLQVKSVPVEVPAVVTIRPECPVGIPISCNALKPVLHLLRYPCIVSIAGRLFIKLLKPAFE